MNLKTSEALGLVKNKVSSCIRCKELASTRNCTVFGEGHPQAEIMLLGEAAGFEEDRQGRPFVGQSGKLLNSIISACGWKREDLYICNMLKCRPPDNRRPTEEELSNCREYLDYQIKIIKPKWIVCFGSTASKSIIGLNVSESRGKIHDYQGIKVVCTYHPSFLLREPSKKKESWEDMKLIINYIEQS